MLAFEGVEDNRKRICAALTGLSASPSVYPGLRPGLFHVAPLGLRRLNALGCGSDGADVAQTEPWALAHGPFGQQAGTWNLTALEEEYG